MNINVGKSMNTSVGMIQDNTVGMNISETAGMNKTSSIGMLNMLSVGTYFITNVVGKMTEFIQGNKESQIEKDNQKVVNDERIIHSEKDYKIHFQSDLMGNSSEKPNMH